MIPIEIILFVLGFFGGLIASFFNFVVGEIYKKREEKRNKVDEFMFEVINLIAIATSAGYKLKLHEEDRRRVTRAAFQLERLGEISTGQNILSYLNKWTIAYGIFTKKTLEDEKTFLKMVKELDLLTDKILKLDTPQQPLFKKFFR
ncbi:MAG TPA: hypothetical protein VLE44_01945 [Candidatus Saccharimonadales bacterium]|nr:hypothetical protein [Candidatus Saccharimonadales bacterium]